MLLGFLLAGSAFAKDVNGSCKISGLRETELDGTYYFDRMVANFQAFQNDNGYKLYASDSMKYDDVPHYWILSKSWSDDFDSAEQVFWVEPNRKTFAKGDDTCSPSFSMSCLIASSSHCIEHDMHYFCSWEALANEPEGNYSGNQFGSGGLVGQSCPFEDRDPECLGWNATEMEQFIILGSLVTLLICCLGALIGYFCWWKKRVNKTPVTNYGQPPVIVGTPLENGNPQSKGKGSSPV